MWHLDQWSVYLSLLTNKLSLPERVGLRRRGIRDHDRHAGIAAGPDGGVERDTAQKRHAQLLGRLLSAPVREDVGSLSAMAVDEKAHVLDDPQDGHVDLLEHHHSLADVVEGHFLRGGYDNCPGELCLLGQGQLDVTGTGRQVN